MSSNWWADRLGSPQRPSPTPPYTPPAPLPYNPVPQAPMPHQEAPRLPPSSSTASRCPGCGSGNYGSSALAPEAKARCYDCGYPVIQSGSGLGTGVQGNAASGPAKPARQSTTANNFNPQGIIGHI